MNGSILGKVFETTLYLPKPQSEFFDHLALETEGRIQFQILSDLKLPNFGPSLRSLVSEKKLSEACSAVGSLYETCGNNIHP